jgi:hypothetical protein
MPPDLVVVQVRVLAKRIGDVLEDRHGVEQGRALEDHPHVLPRLERFLEREVGDVLPVDADAALVGHEQAEDELERGALARAGFADEADRLARVRDEGHVLEDGSVEGEPDVIQLDDGRRVLCRVGEGVVDRHVARQLGADGAAHVARLPLGAAATVLAAVARSHMWLVRHAPKSERRICVRK